LINTLPQKIFDQLNFRFHPGNVYCEDYISKNISPKRIKTFKKNIILDNNFMNIISRHRLLIFNYNSTGFVEGMGTNRPSLLFLNKSITKFNNNEKHTYRLLENSGILHFTQKSLIRHLIKIQHDLDSWWESKEVLIARKQFCKKFVNYKDNYLDGYIKVINQ